MKCSSYGQRLKLNPALNTSQGNMVIAMALIGIGEATVEMQNGLIDAAVWGVRWGVGGALAGWWLGKD